MEIHELFQSIELTLPSLKIFKIPPEPLVRVPLISWNTPIGKLFHPIKVNPEFFQLSMNPEFVFTFVAVYVTAVCLLNQFNAGRQYKPWISNKNSTFKAFMTAHNALLALFSAWAYCGMAYTGYSQWGLARSGVEGGYLAHLTEFLCRLDSKHYRSKF